MSGRSAAAPATAPAARAGARHASALRFASVLLGMTLLLQRFGLPLGGKSFSIVGPLGLALAGWYLARGVLALNRFRLMAYIAFACCVALGMAWQATRPVSVLTGFTGGADLDSLAQFLPLTAFAVLDFAEPVDEAAFFRMVTAWFGVIAAAGLAQFAAQFAGAALFAFTGLLPASLLIEHDYNLIIPLGVDHLLKSNGFFLVEPSTFSQIMALALVIEALSLRRRAWLLLFAGGLLVAFSGTGWIVLAAFLLVALLAMGLEGLAIAGGILVLLGVLAGATAWLAPDIAASVLGRLNEVFIPGTSGHDRFITPFWVLSDVLRIEPSAALLGIGAGVSERLQLPYEYDVNTPVKVLLEYGAPALLAYLALFLGARRSRVQAGLLLPAMVMFLFAGGYQQFPPVLFMVLLLITVARLAPAPARSTA